VLSRILRALGGLALAAAISAPALADASGFASPRAGATLTGGSIAEVRWRALDAGPTTDVGLDEAELVLSLDGGRTFPIRVSAELEPDASSYRWRVPSFRTASARLALRVGAGHERGRERLLRISDEFAISAAPTEGTTLETGAAEWWTEQALHERTARDLLGGTVRGGEERLVAVVTEHDADNPSPGPALSIPAARTAPFAAHRASRPRLARRSCRPAPASVPLRL
jgi:hypothetical protein